MLVHRTACMYLDLELRPGMIYRVLAFDIIYQNHSLGKDTNTFYLNITLHIVYVLQTLLRCLYTVCTILATEMEKL